eukprot:1282788-Rhodomonas_salina.2
MLDPSFNEASDLHPNTVVVALKTEATVLLVYRSSTLFAHPVHIHGHRFEVCICVCERGSDCGAVRVGAEGQSE